ncbi:hypothetical protein P872_03770 [Rhodonellum psychrophilum GCM71 = DSM 17998]|uniref:Uncharacterized protein n=1 Tax=Rhodonellum psychrophilum GCM71 = DSM 17998 TaxID=1123057 RepID=U5BY58_9BACT|nr:hypothetical protein P872_03770 [Rhodonellum psychrophilum GCM71 = DSM 17998]
MKIHFEVFRPQEFYKNNLVFIPESGVIIDFKVLILNEKLNTGIKLVFNFLLLRNHK